MSILKRADLSGRVVVARVMLECPKCGHKDVTDGNADVDCPKCNTRMVVAYCSAGQDNICKE